MADDHKKVIVFAINDFLVGGAQRLYLDLMSGLDDPKYKLILVTSFSFENRATFYSRVPSFVEIVDLGFKGFIDFGGWLRAIQFLKKYKPNVVISSLFFSNTVFRKLKFFFGYKIISIEHNTYINKRWWEILIDSILSNVTDRLIAVSETVADFTSKQERISREKFIVIENGINISEINQKTQGLDLNEVKNELGFLDSDKVIVNVGRLTEQKNQKVLIEGFARFLESNPNYHLVILGEGSLRDELEKLLENLGLTGHVHLPGSVDNVYRYYVISDFFVSTSTIEGFGIAHAEAMASGLPMLSTKTAGPDKMIEEGKNGYFIDNNPDSVKTGLDKMISSDLSSLGKYSRVVSSRYDISKTIQNYGRLIESLV